jgi:UDP-2,4-diacetamido-2,4,6-trideoxy-beta-L-altropyranose hydrolase
MSAMGKHFVFRVDAASFMGMGHLRRCVSLSKALTNSGGECTFVARDWGSELSTILGDFAKSLILLPTSASADPDEYATWVGRSLEEDAMQFCQALGDATVDWVIVDHYGINDCWHKWVRERNGCSIAAIDDLANRPIDCDLVIDQNWHVDHEYKFRRVNIAGARILGGPRYAMLDPTYTTAPKWNAKAEVETIGVFLGGADAIDAMSPTLDMIEQTGFKGRVKFVLGSNNPAASALRRRAAQSDQMDVLENLPNLADFFAQCDLQIGAGGSATWERCCIGAPTLALVCADNQREILHAMASAGYQWGAELDDRLLQQQLLRLALTDQQARADMSARCQLLVDGKGAQRIAKILTADQRLSIHVRAASMADAERMYRWRNDVRVREVSRDDGEIALSDHLRWLESALPAADRHILVGESPRGKPVGVVRFDALDERRFEVSIYLDPECVGAGIGGPLLREAENELVKRINSPVDIIAFTLSGNKASERLFENGGYHRVGDHFEKHRLG